MAKPQGLGGKGEDLATAFLLERGHEILARNFRSRFGEIDIISKFGGFLCFIEVKTRNPSKNLTSGFEAVTHDKQLKIYKTAEYFIVKHPKLVEHDGLQPRFDCIEINVDEKVEISYLENAFEF